VSLEVLLIKCRDVHRLSNLSKEITEPKMGVATSWFHEKCVLTMDFCTALISIKIARTVHIPSAVMGCHSFTLECLKEKY
jgi:hypothetical protein